MSVLTEVHGYGLLSARPAAGHAGREFYATDTQTRYRDNGSSWDAQTSPGIADPTTTRGDMLFRNNSGAVARLALGAANTVLHGSATDPSYSAVVPADIDVSADIATGNVTAGHHGFAPKLDGNAAHYLDGTGAYSTPAGGGGGRPAISAIALNGTYGDDFTGASLDAKWTQRGSAVHTYQSGGGSWLRMAHASGGSELIRQNAPAGDFEIVVAYSQWMNATGDNIMVGPMIVDSSGNGLMCCHYWNSNNPFMGSLSAWGYGSGLATLSAPTLEYAFGAPLWMGLKKSGTNYSFRFSHDGYNWSPYSSTSSQAFTVAYIGFGRHNGTATTTISNLDVFNLI